MRNDMSKIMTEPARRGVRYYGDLPNEYRRAKTFKLDDDLEVNDEFCNHVLPMRSKRVGWDGKDKNYTTRPIKGFFLHAVGRKWNDVYSELCAALKNSISARSFLRDISVSWIGVELNTYVGEDGNIYFNDKYRADQPIENADFYVDPRDGILYHNGGSSYNSRYKKSAAEREAAKEVWRRKVNNTFQFHKIDGNWYRVYLGPSSDNGCDALGMNMSTNRWNHWDEKRNLFNKYGINGVWAIRKEAASKRDIRKHNLN